MEGWGPEVPHCVPGFPRSKGDAVLGTVVKRQQGQEYLEFSPRGCNTGESARGRQSLTGSVEGYLIHMAMSSFFTCRLYSCLANGSMDEFQRGISCS